MPLEGGVQACVQLVEGVDGGAVVDDAAGPGEAGLAVDGAGDAQNSGEVADACAVVPAERGGGSGDGVLPSLGQLGQIYAIVVVDDGGLVEQPPRVEAAAGMHPDGGFR
jgi:hypothetical protein